jgi:hypothetical protein
MKTKRKENKSVSYGYLLLAVCGTGPWHSWSSAAGSLFWCFGSRGGCRYRRRRSDARPSATVRGRQWRGGGVSAPALCPNMNASKKLHGVSRLLLLCPGGHLLLIATGDTSIKETTEWRCKTNAVNDDDCHQQGIF